MALLRAARTRCNDRQRTHQLAAPHLPPAAGDPGQPPLALFAPPARRYRGGSAACRRRPGWEYLYVCIDDASRVAYTAIHPDEAAESAVEFLWYAVAWYAALGMKIERVLTDNGICYKSRKVDEACREFGIQHKRIRTYRP